MPQLMATIIVVVGAIIYMFQTFGGIGNKILSIAQKPSVLTEIYNIKSGVSSALKYGDISVGTTLQDLANKGYFDIRVRQQLLDTSSFNKFKSTLKKSPYNKYDYISGRRGSNVFRNLYSAISFGGRENPAMLISLISGGKGNIPGIRVQLIASLDESKGFLEKQITNDLSVLALCDRGATWGDYTLSATKTLLAALLNPTNSTNETGEYKAIDGIFTIYFKDLDGTIK